MVVVYFVSNTNVGCNLNATMRRSLEFARTDKLKKVFQYLCDNIQYQMKAPSMTASKKDGSGSKTLYMTNINAIEEMTRPNLEKTLEELDLEDQQEILVADATTPQTMIFRLKFL